MLTDHELEQSIKRKDRKRFWFHFLNGFCSILYIFGGMPKKPDSLKYSVEEWHYLYNQDARKKGHAEISIEDYKLVFDILQDWNIV